MTSKVLIVDDEVNVLKSLRRALRNEPYTVLTAQSAEEGLAILEAEQCTVVLSDEKMPAMSGTAFLARVKERFPDTIRMMLTGHATLEAAMKAVNEGEIYRFFSKPWDDVDLRFSIASALEKHELEVRNAALLRALPDDIVRCDRNGTCLEYQPATAPPSPFPANHFIGKRPAEVFPADVAAEMDRRRERVFASGEIEIFEFTVQTPVGVRHLEARMVRSGIDELLIVGRDITDRKEAVAALTAQREKLRTFNTALETRVRQEMAKNREKDRVLAHQARHAAMGEMIGAIAHQWRQPLTAASSLVQNLTALSEAGCLTAEALQSTVDAAQRQIRFMSETIDELRTFFRPEKDVERFELRETVKQALRIVSPQMESAGIEARVVARESGSLMIEGYPQELKQVMVNLLNNARQAIEDRKAHSDGTVPTGCIEVAIEHAADSLRIIIRDNGCGIPAAVRERIFDPYFTTRSDGGGTGIGLYMSKTIIESSMAGRLYLQEGATPTTFVIELPGVK